MMKSIRIWDLPTRLFHWLLAAAIFALIATGMTGGDAIVWHFRLGYAVLAMLLFRLVWGVCGGHWSRFVHVLPAPAALLRYLRRQATPADTAGHNPLGALAVFAILAIMLAQVVSGLMVDDEIFYWGRPRCVWARESTAPAQGNQSLSRELRASALCPGLEAQFPARRREERGCRHNIYR